MSSNLDRSSRPAPTRLLLVEDDQVDAQLIQRMLVRGESDLFTVRHASALAEAAQVLKDGPSPDIVLLDLSLPDANRDETIEFICEIGASSPVVVLTGSDDDALAMEAARNGAQDYLVKWEFNPPFLCRSIRYAIERQQTERQLRAALQLAESANAAKSSFLAMMTHELRAPLNAVLGMAELLSDGKLDPEQLRYVGALNRAGRHLLHVVDDVLDLTRIESGRFGVDYQRFEVRPLIIEPVEFMQHSTGSKPIAIECEIDSAVPNYLIGDPSRLKQVLVNLLGNAIKFSERGQVRLSVGVFSQEGAQCELWFKVSDTGIGIAAEHLGRIFDSFAQADLSITRRFGGSGLGLTISKRLVELMGGTIQVESELGRGSTFSFTVRATLPDLEAAGTGARSGEPEPPSSRKPILPEGMHVLLVDDAEESELLVNAFLGQLGHTVRTVSGGEAALQALRIARYDVVLMDVHMPGMDGFMVTSEIRRMEKLNDADPVPVLFMTANTLSETRLRATVAGGTSLITKPITRQRLLTAIEAVLAESRESRDRSKIAVSAPPDSSQVSDLLSRVDRVTRPLLPRYVAARRTDVALMKAALERGDHTVVQTLGHNMKGSGSSYGLAQVTALGDGLEVAAIAGDWTAIAEHVAALETFLERVEQVMHDRVTPAPAP